MVVVVGKYNFASIKTTDVKVVYLQSRTAGLRQGGIGVWVSFPYHAMYSMMGSKVPKSIFIAAVVYSTDDGMGVKRGIP